MSRNNFNKKGSSAANGFQKKNFKNRNNHFDDFESEQECDQLNGNNEIVIVKNNYEPVVNSEKEEVDSWMCENEVKLHGQEIPCPIFAFDQTTFPNMIQKLLFNNFEKPTPIQSISWPVALSGLDLVSIARTGSGKTLGFLLPAIVHIISQRSRNSQIGPIVVILLPTRELAQQVEGVAKEYCNSMRLNLVCCYGGAPKGPQLRAMRNGVDICVATPGRLNDFLNTGAVNMSGCSFLVMDEADRMLDMGFEPQIRTIVKRIRNDRQTLMFSATWPKEVRKLADEFQNNPVHLTVGSLELSANHNIKQNIEVFSDWHEKTDRLLSLLKEIMQKEQKKTIIFVATKRKADELAIKVRQSGHQALCIHGDKDQNERNWVLDQFKKGKTSILLATDVAARGIDISDIKFVVNYDFPNTTEDYVHRIGRTGRSDQLGTAYSFFTGSDRPKARDLIKVLEEAKQDVPEELAAMAPMGGFGRGNSGKWSGNNRKRNWNSGGNGQFGGQSKRTKFNDDGNWQSGQGANSWNKPNNAQRKNNWTANSGGGSRW